MKKSDWIFLLVIAVILALVVGFILGAVLLK